MDSADMEDKAWHGQKPYLLHAFRFDRVFY
jgi:hypothetical protein